MTYIEVGPGEHIGDAAKRAAELARLTDQPVLFEFNAVWVRVEPGAAASKIVYEWDTHRNNTKNAWAVTVAPGELTR